MSQLSIRRFPEILKRMRVRTVTRAGMSDLNDSSSVDQTLQAAAHEDADQWRAISKVRQVLDLTKVRGPDLDELVKTYNDAILNRWQATYSTGQVVFSRAVAGLAIGGDAGVEVQVPAAAGQPALRFYTTAAWAIGAGLLSSAPVPIRAAEPGSKYQVVAGAITGFGSKPSGVDAVSNAAPTTPAQDRETDDHLVQRVVLYKKSLARGTRTALLYAALGATDATGKVCTYAAVVTDRFNPGRVMLYIDDGAGTAESIATAIGETLLAAAVGGEKDLYTDHKPIKDELPMEFRVNAVPKVRGTDYTLDAPWGQWKVTQAIYPTGLPAGAAVTGDYSYYTGLVAEVQKIIDGDDSDRLNYPGYAAAGDLVRVVVPSVLWVYLQATLVVQRGFDRPAAVAAVKSVWQTYINSRGIGEDVILNELRALAMSVPGVYDLSIALPTDNLLVLETQIARCLLAGIDVT